MMQTESPTLKSRRLKVSYMQPDSHSSEPIKPNLLPRSGTRDLLDPESAEARYPRDCGHARG
jgi:hypothetical protein